MTKEDIEYCYHLAQTARDSVGIPVLEKHFIDKLIAYLTEKAMNLESPSPSK